MLLDIKDDDNCEWVNARPKKNIFINVKITFIFIPDNIPLEFLSALYNQPLNYLLCLNIRETILYFCY